MEIPIGFDRNDIKTRKQIIKDFYAKWNASNPEKKVWNRSLKAYIHVKYQSVNETCGKASISYESTLEVFRLTEILANAILVSVQQTKKGNKNQKPYLEMLVMNCGSAQLIVGKQRSTGEYVQYCIRRKK